jgi:hypothetical protein
MQNEFLGKYSPASPGDLNLGALNHEANLRVIPLKWTEIKTATTESPCKRSASVMLQTMANFSSQVGAELASPRSKRSSAVAHRFCEGGRELLDGSSAGDAKDESSDAKHDGVGRDCREQIAGASLEEEPRSSRPRPRPSSIVDSTGATPKAESKSLEQLLARSSTFHILTLHCDDVEATRHCDDVKS